MIVKMTIIKLVFILLLLVYGSSVRALDREWWKRGVFYQVYPSSFKDSNNDGVGDIRGIIQKLDHFVDAGITAIWLSPIYKSPQVDQGYDISDYRDVDPIYGDLNDLKDLIREVKKKGLKIILDFVPNHTSDQHEWFQKSINGIEPYSDYYIWKKCWRNEFGEIIPPNNWISVFHNSTWTWNDKRKMCFMHQFSPAQPDLNFRNPNVIQEMKDILKYWLDMGVDGFRIDAVPFIVEDDEFRDEPLSNASWAGPQDYGYLKHIYTFNQPLTFEIIYDWRTFVDDYNQKAGGDERILMTEAYCNLDQVLLFYGKMDGSRLGAHFAFNFILLTDVHENSNAYDFAHAINHFLDSLPRFYTPNWVLGNHDQHRVGTRFGSENIDGFNMFMALLPGIGVTYYGEEIGMVNSYVPYEQGKDPAARDPRIYNSSARDFERTPFQWDSSINAGFNDGAPTWLPVGDNYEECNLADENEDRVKSHYHVYKDLLKLRKNPIIRDGTAKIRALNENVVLLNRTLEVDSAVMLFNIANQVENISLNTTTFYKVVITSTESKYEVGSIVDLKKFSLAPHESIVLLSN